MDNNKLTVYDVAKHAGVSVATVSKVLNRRRGVKEDTIATVNRVIKEIGFHPRWNAGANQTVGLIIPPFSAQRPVNNYFSVIVDSIFETLSARNFSLQLAAGNLTQDPARPKYLLSADARLAGLIAVTNPCNYELCNWLMKESGTFPVAVIGKLADTQAKETPKWPTQVFSDDYSAGYQLATLLVRQNHRHFCLNCANMEDVCHQHRLSGMLDALKDYGVPGECIQVINNRSSNVHSSAAPAISLACANNHPDAFLFTNGGMCVAFVNECRLMNLRIPEEFSVAGFEDFNELEMLPVRVTSINIPSHYLAVYAVELLFRQIERQELPPPGMVKFELQLRDSVLDRRNRQ